MQVSEALKELYRTDSIDKSMIAEFCRPGQSEPFLTVHEGRRFIDMSLEESLCSDENIEWGSCEASQIKLTIIGLNGAGIKGSEMTLYQTLDGASLLQICILGMTCFQLAMSCHSESMLCSLQRNRQTQISGMLRRWIICLSSMPM